MSKLFKNILYNLFGQGALLCLSLFSVRYIFRQLGQDVLGIIFFTGMVNTLLSTVSQMGITATIVREVAAHYNTDRQYIKELVQTASLFFWVAYILLSLSIFFLSPLIVEKWINLDSLDNSSAIFMLRILGIASIIALPKSLYVSLFRGIQRMEFNNGIEVITTGIQHLGVIILLILHKSLYAVVYWYAACFLLRISIYIYFSVKYFGIELLIPVFNLNALKRNLFFTSRMLASTVLSITYMQIDKIIISKLLPISSLGYYSMMYNSVFKARMFPGAVAQAAYPNFSSLYHDNNGDDKLGMQYRILQDLLCYGMVPVCALIIFSFLPVFSYILSKEIGEMLMFPMTILCIGIFMQTAGIIPHYMTLGMGRPEIPMNINFYVLIFNVPITFILIYKYGLLGASLSFITSRVIAWYYGIGRICRECLQMSVFDWYYHILKILLLSFATYGAAWGMLTLNQRFTILNLFAGYVIASIGYVFVSYFMIGEELKVAIYKKVDMLYKTMKKDRYTKD
jgi:O-antigen/teichoic acid export membrane protein